MFHYACTNEILQTASSKLILGPSVVKNTVLFNNSVQSLMNKPPPKTPTEDTTYLERMT